VDIQIVDYIEEQSQGEWEGKDRPTTYTADVLEQLKTNSHNFKAPGGESQLDVENRMRRFLEEKIMPLYKTGVDVNVAVFGHAFAFKCLLRAIMKFDTSFTWKVEISNTAISEVAFDENGWHLMRVNDTRHIDLFQLKQNGNPSIVS